MNLSKNQTQSHEQDQTKKLFPCGLKAISQRLYYFVALTLTFGMPMSAGCSKGTVTIQYRQVANWYEFVTNSSAGAGQGMFMMYKITSIDNSKSNTAYTFKVDNLYAKNYPGEPYFNGDLLHKAEDITVNSGQKVTDVGCIILKVASNDPPSLQLALIPLLYHYDGSEGGHPLSIVREANNLTVPFISPAQPNHLLQFCPNE